MAGETENKQDLNLDDLNSLLNGDGADISNEIDEADEEAAFEAEFNSDSDNLAIEDDKTKDVDTIVGDDDGKVTGEDDKSVVTDEDNKTVVDGKDDKPAGDDLKVDDKAADADSDKDKSASEMTPLEIQLTNRLRNIESKYGELNSKMTRLLDAGKDAKKEVDGDGGETPTVKQIREAMNDGAKYKALKSQFPEWSEALSESVGLATAGILEKIPDVNTIRAELKADLETERGMIHLDIKHEGWKDTVNSEEFLEWAHQDGPNANERGIYYGLKAIEDDRTEAYFGALMKKYPVWGEGNGVLLNSDDPLDSIKMLDQFKQSLAASADDGKGSELDDKTSKDDKLSRNVSATKSTRAPDRIVSDTEEEAFEAEFNR